MPHVSTCPTRDELRLWMAGLAPDLTIESLSEHIIGCPRCVELIRNLSPGDDKLSSLLGRPLDPLSDEEREVVHQLIDTACQWRLGDTDTHVSLPSNVGQATDGLPERVDPCDAAVTELQNILAVSQSAGELGRLGPFIVRRIIGVGGMGIVMVAEDVQLGREVAIKVMRPHLAINSAARERFLREARAMAAVSHDHVVSVYQVGEERGAPFFAMPVLDGESLQSRLARQPRLPIADVIQIGVEISAGLAAAHARGLIHRDIKPGNIWLERCSVPEGADAVPTFGDPESIPNRFRVKILDFGLVRVAAESLELTATGYIAGTPAYMSPEHARGRTIDERSDLFSLGCVLYEACTGFHPFPGSNPTAILLALVGEPPQRVLALNSAVPPNLALAIERLLEKDPAQRFQKAAQVHTVFAVLAQGAVSGLPNGQGSFGSKGQGILPFTVGRGWVLLAAAVMVLLAAAAAIPLIDRMKNVGSAVTDKVPEPTEQSLSNSPPIAAAPFDSAEAQSYQQAWADHLRVDVEYANSIGMRLRLIPPGKFLMGNSDAEVNALLVSATSDKERALFSCERPQRSVTLTRPFYCGTTEVTRGQFRCFIEATGIPTDAETNGVGSVAQLDGKYAFSQRHTWSTDPGTTSDDQPVTCVSWNDARRFCDFLSEQEKVSYSLPTEAQWEFACRAGSVGQWSLGDRDGNDAAGLSGFAWLDDTDHSHPVAQKAANAFGLYDMHGNVWEWCADWFDPNYYASGAANDPEGALNGGTHGLRVLRGGSFNFAPMRARSAHRNNDAGSAPAFNRGFRVVISGDWETLAK